MWDFYVLSCVIQKSGFGITAENLDLIIIPASHKDKAPIRR